MRYSSQPRVKSAPQTAFHRLFGQLLGHCACTLLLAVGLVAGNSPAAQAADSLGLTVFAAASLQNAIDDVNAAFAAQHSATLKSSYASSSVLAKQIEAGAQADIFISADRDWMKYLADRQLTADSAQTDLLGNRLVLIARAEDSAKLKLAPAADLRRALDGGRLAMGEVNSVPAGKYGKAALQSLGLWQTVQDRVVGAENVRAALKLVALGEAKFGIVYESDAKIDQAVRIVDTFPQDSHPPIIYPAALTSYAAARSDGGAELAKTYVDFLRSKEAAAIFTRYGFTPLH